MQYTKKEIISIIQNTVREVTKVNVDSDNVTLLNLQLDIHPADFLYIFDELERRLEIPVTEVLKGYDYSIFRVDKLSDAFMEMLECKK